MLALGSRGTPGLWGVRQGKKSNLPAPQGRSTPDAPAAWGRVHARISRVCVTAICHASALGPRLGSRPPREISRVCECRSAPTTLPPRKGSRIFQSKFLWIELLSVRPEDLETPLPETPLPEGPRTSLSGPGTCHHPDMGKRRGGSARSGARWLSQPRGARLFDPAGLEYELSRAGLRRADVTRLLNSTGMPVAVHECGQGVHWCSSDRAAAQWADAQADFEDVMGWRPPADAPGTQPYRAELWKSLSQGAEVVVLRND